MAVGQFYIVGPLAPPFGGARVSFSVFWDYVQENEYQQEVKLLNLPTLCYQPEYPYGKIDRLKTIASLIVKLPALALSNNVVLFASKNFGLACGLLLALFCKVFGVRFSIRFFGGHPASVITGARPLLRRLIVLFLSKIDKIIVQTHVGASEFPDRLRNKIIVVPGYRKRESQAKPYHQGLEKIPFRFAYLGAINQLKGVAELIHVVQEMQAEGENCELDIFGFETEPGFLKRNPGVYNAHLDLRRGELFDLLRTCDALVFPSQYSNEGHPGVVIEAFMVGLPVVASSLPCLSEIIVDQENGLLFKPGDVDSLKCAMLRLIKEPELCQKLSVNSAKSFEKYDAELVLPVLAAECGLVL